jgi:hypothetical protein
MATPADQRLLDLLGRWLESLELHSKYSSLDDDSYWKIQPWSEHQRPSLWILNLAKQKTLALRAHLEERVQMGDAKFSEALELMAFLANLVGSEHLERFIPVANKENERALPSASAETTGRTPTVSVTATREMPNFLATKRSAPPAGTPQVARTERRAAAAKPPVIETPVTAKSAAKAHPKPAAKRHPTPAERAAPSEASRDQVIADAARLVQWGRKWYELPELIARMADRPALPEVRRILKENKAAIEKKVGTA